MWIQEEGNPHEERQLRESHGTKARVDSDQSLEGGPAQSQRKLVGYVGVRPTRNEIVQT